MCVCVCVCLWSERDIWSVVLKGKSFWWHTSITNVLKGQTERNVHMHECNCKCRFLCIRVCLWTVCVSARVHAQQIASVYLVWGDSRKEGRLTSCWLQAPRHMVITQPQSTPLSHTHTHTQADNASTWVRKQTSSTACRHFQVLLHQLKGNLTPHSTYITKQNR